MFSINRNRVRTTQIEMIITPLEEKKEYVLLQCFLCLIINSGWITLFTIACLDFEQRTGECLHDQNMPIPPAQIKFFYRSLDSVNIPKNTYTATYLSIKANDTCEGFPGVSCDSNILARPYLTDFRW